MIFLPVKPVSPWGPPITNFPVGLIKYFIFSEAERFPITFATGFENISSKSSSNFYIVVSKALNKKLSLHGGFKAIFAEELNPKFMAGCEYYHFKKLSILADINGENKEYELNIGARLNLFKNIQLRVNYLDMLNAAKNGQVFSSGIAYRKFI